MKITINVDFENVMNNSFDPPQRDWSITDFENDFMEQLEELIGKLEGETGVDITIKQEYND